MSCRPGASLSTPASLGSRPCGRLCASHHVQAKNAERQCFLVYFKMLQLNESLFRSLPFSYKNTVLLIQLKKFKWLLLQEKFTASPGTMKLGPSPAPHHWLPKDFVPVSICYLGTGFLGTDTPLHHTPKTTARLLCFQCKPLINGSNYSIFYVGLDVGRGHKLAPGPSWATTAGGSIMGPTSSKRSLARACKAPSHQRPPLEAAGRVSAGDVFSHKCKERRQPFPTSKAEQVWGQKAAALPAPLWGPQSVPGGTSPCAGEGKPESSDERSSKKVP